MRRQRRRRNPDFRRQRRFSRQIPSNFDVRQQLNMNSKFSKEEKSDEEKGKTKRGKTKIKEEKTKREKS